MLQNVADENIIAFQIHRRENLCEELAGGTHERQPFFIFGRARRLADDHQARVRIALTRNRIRRRCIQRTARARRDGLRDGVE